MNKTVKRPLSLLEILPQKPPMVLVDDFVWPKEGEQSVTSSVTITEDSPFYSSLLKGVPACTVIEYMAQTMAIAVGIDHYLHDLPLSIGFLLGSRRLTLRVPFLPLGERYLITAEPLFTDESFGSFACEVKSAKTGDIVASAQLTAFQPDANFSGELPS